ncbi:MAG: RNA methyltransferase, partial [Prevotella sp.]|nr:RNA methyltransferase [Prevotella sp.]
GKRCSYEIRQTMPQKRSWRGHLHIAMAPTKMMERTEWMAEKATEIGVNEFSFLECQFSERRQMRSDRIEKIVVSATKQSRKAWKPQVNEMQSFRSFIEQPREGQKFICHCYNEIPRKDLFEELQKADVNIPVPVNVLIGPEGDFSIEEVKMAMEHGYQSVSLGTQRLRTETAALSSVMIMQLTHRF